MSRHEHRSSSRSFFVDLLTTIFDRTELNSIQRRQTAIAFVFIIGTAVAMGMVGFRFTVKFENERFKENFNLMASYLASNAELGVMLGDEKILQGLTENMLTVEDVQFVEIVDRGGAVIIRRANVDLVSSLNYVTAPVLSSAIGELDNPGLDLEAIDGEVLGEVKIGYSLIGLESLKKQLALGFLLISLLLAIVPTFLYWRLSKTIRAPFKELMQVARDVSQGDLDVRARVGKLQETKTLASAFNEMLDALQRQRRQIREANEAVSRQKVLAEVGKFSMMMAHEIKNPLAIIKGSLGVLFRKETVSPELKGKMIGFLHEEIERINRLVEDFLVFARPRPPVFQTVTLEKLLGSMEQRIRLIEPKIMIVNEVKQDLSAELSCDLALLERALLNLVRNALEATRDVESVQVNMSSEEDSLTFAVLDNGPGMNPDDIEHIFEPFFSKKAKGTGLGLTIAKGAVTSHKGVLTAENCVDGGACFMMRIPLLGEELTDHDATVQKG